MANLATLHSCMRVLKSADNVAETASKVPFAQREQRQPFAIRPVNAREIQRPASKVEQAGIMDNAKPQQILAALREVANDSERTDLDAREKEALEMLGQLAEIKAQVLEVRSDEFVAGRVEEATAAQRAQAEAAAKQLKRTRQEAEVLRAELGELDEALDAVEARKRARQERLRAEAAAAPAPAEAAGGEEDPAKLQLDLVAVKVKEAEVEEAVLLAVQREAQAAARREAVAESKRAEEVRLASRLAQAEGRLKDDPDFQAALARVHAAGAARATADAAAKQADAHLEALQAPPPPPPRTKWTRRVPHPVLIGHVASLAPY